MRILLSILPLFLAVSCGPPRAWKFASDHAIREALTTDDPTQISRIIYQGRGERTVGDARLWSGEGTGRKYGRTTINAYLFEVSFGAGMPKIEFIVNPEVGELREAVQLVQVYGYLVGQWPREFLRSCESVVIHLGTPEGVAAFASDPTLVVHHGHLANSMRWGTIEELLLHESAHLALDHHTFSDEWKAAVKADGRYITKYAMTNEVEDIAESFVYYYALRYRSKRLSGLVKRQITDAIPNRIRFFDRFFGFSAPN